MCELFDSPACYLFRVIESAPLHLCRVPSVAPAAPPPCPGRSRGRSCRVSDMCKRSWVVIFFGQLKPLLALYSSFALTFIIYRHLHTNRRPHEPLC